MGGTHIGVVNLLNSPTKMLQTYVILLSLFAAFGGFMFGYDIGYVFVEDITAAAAL